MNGYAWNTTEHHGNGYSAELALLEKWWDVKVREDWLEIERRLLGRDVGSSAWDDVLSTRNLLADRFGGPVDGDRWRQFDESVLRENGARSGAPAQPGADPELDEFAAYRGDLIMRILRYEERFRDDGVLSHGGYVRSTAAWDLGRASAMARWGRSTRFCTRAEMFGALRGLSEEAQRRYGSWEEFGVGYLLGTEQSPWLTVPFR